ncbi:MAG: capsule assembly Wzi family protein, partial [Pseudomonadota bacterium]
MMRLSAPLQRAATAIVFAATTALCSTAAMAGPWLEPGDRQVRQDIELLKAHGLIYGPLDSWPIPWMQVSRGLETARQTAQPPHIAAAVRRLETLARREEQGRRVEARLRATNEPDKLRDFEDSAREDVDVDAEVQFDTGRLTVVLGGGYREDQDGFDGHVENSFLAYAAGNWALYGGYVERWWGPGQDTTLLFSTNARAFPQIGVRRLLPAPIDLPVLRWLGPVSFSAFAGILTEDRETSGFNDPAIVGFRGVIEPVEGLEIGFSRGIQLCGEDRPCDGETIIDALFPFSGVENTGTLDEPGNQLAGIDLVYRFTIGGLSASAYTEWQAEDESGIFV